MSANIETKEDQQQFLLRRIVELEKEYDMMQEQINNPNSEYNIKRRLMNYFAALAGRRIC